ncbi:MAG TPA: hypothetical protein VM937_13555 [Burkholderiaceae bacterium]|jgi:hypothetical protein|nr:hypothetical protein [Burkholderiaceae bacterium]
MSPTPTWAVHRDAKTGRLMRKYISNGEVKSPQKTEKQKNKRP